MIRIYSTLSRKKEDFSLPQNKRIDFFVCGPTVYSSSHIGHARTYIAFDTIIKYLRSEGYDVFYLQNITDIDDKIINRAKELNQNWQEVSNPETDRYYADMKRIKVDSVSKYVLASACISNIKSQIERLIKKGHAYASGGSVYFDISTFPDFGKLSRQDLTALQKAQRTGKDKEKKHQHDFVLWRGRTGISGEPSWDSPWGPGRPGWHIEDTAITEAEFDSPQYELHGGGIELIFPHHEAEIAQMESISGKRPFVRYWLHTGWVTVKGEKMSKSLGNFITIKEILKKYSPEALRLLLLQTHYRSPLEYSSELMDSAERAVQKIREVQARIERIQKNGTFGNEKTTELSVREKIQKAMNDDFNTPSALGEFFRFIGELDAFFAKKNMLSKEALGNVVALFGFIESLFGIIPEKRSVPEEILKKVLQREELRAQKKWDEADMARKELRNDGWGVEDTPDGPLTVHAPQK